MTQCALTRLRDPRLTLFKRWVDLQLIWEFDTITLATGLQDYRLKAWGCLIDCRDRCFNEVGIDDAKALEIRLLNVGSENDMCDSVNARNLLLHPGNNIVNRA